MQCMLRNFCNTFFVYHRGQRTACIIGQRTSVGIAIGKYCTISYCVGDLFYIAAAAKAASRVVTADVVFRTDGQRYFLQPTAITKCLATDLLHCIRYHYAGQTCALVKCAGRNLCQAIRNYYVSQTVTIVKCPIRDRPCVGNSNGRRGCIAIPPLIAAEHGVDPVNIRLRLVAVGNGGQDIAIGVHQQRSDRCNNVRYLLTLRDPALHDLPGSGKHVHTVDDDRRSFLQCGDVAIVVGPELGKLFLRHCLHRLPILVGKGDNTRVNTSKLSELAGQAGNTSSRLYDVS